MIQSFNEEMDALKMETCSRCNERWFEMHLQESVCSRCRDQDKNNKIIPFLMSRENNMDPGELPPHLPVLTQVEEMIIARAHVQMVVKRYRGHQYHYTGHCKFRAKSSQDRQRSAQLARRARCCPVTAVR